ncbi:PEGA domain-containing protein, partial [bacterium]|nr:PEGA domain-containing protein [bacterium]
QKKPIKENYIVKKGNFLKNINIEKKGKTVVNTLPENAKIYLNGNFIGYTPKEIEGLKSGVYIVEVRKGGYAPYKGKVHLTEGRIITIKKELKEVVELKDLISDINIPRQKTNAKKAMLLGFIPGAGGIYNGYPKKGIATILGTIMPLMGTLLANNNISTYESRLNDNPEISLYDQYAYEIQNNNIELSKNQLYLSIPFIGFGYLYSVLSSYFDAKSDFYEKQYLLFSFNGYTYSINQSQTPDELNQPAYFNEGIHSLIGSKNSMNISLGFISKYYDMFFQMGVYEPFLASIDLSYKIPVYKALSLGLGWYLGSYFDNDPTWYETNPTVEMDVVIPSIGTSYFAYGNIIINSNNFYLNLGYSPNSIVAAYTFTDKSGNADYTFLHGFDMLCKAYYFINDHLGLNFSGRYGNYEAPPYEKYETITRVDNLNYIELRLGMSLRY